MEFLVTNLRDLPPEGAEAGGGILARLDAARYTHWFGAMQARRLDHATLFVAESALSDPARMATFSGYALLDHGKRLVHQFDCRGVRPGPASDFIGANGIYACFDYSRPGDLRLWSDPTSQYHIHIYERDGDFIASNNLHMLRILAEAAGLPLTRSVAGMMFSLSYGTHFGRQSAFEEVRLLAPRHMIHLGPDGVRSREYLSQAAHFLSPDHYEEDIARTADLLRNSAHTILDLGQKTCVDVTGGVDSRVALAAMLATGRKEEFAGYNLSRRPNPDRLVPELLLAQAGLGLSDAKVINQTCDFTLEERCRRGVYRFCGMRLIDQPDIGELVLPNLTRISGGFGELGCGPGPNPALWALKRSGPLAYADGWVRRKPPEEIFLTPEAVDRVAATIAAKIAEAGDNGIPVHLIDPVVYAENKAMHHFGIAHRFFNDTRWHIPMLNLAELVRCGTLLDIPRVKGRKVHFDLIRALADDDLALAPLAFGRWHPAAIPDSLKAHHEATAPVMPGSAPLAEPLVNRARKTFDYLPLSSEEQAFRQRMNALGLNARFQNAPRYLALIRDLFEDIPAADRVWETLDRSGVKKVLTLDEPGIVALSQSHPQTVGRFAMLAQGLMWYRGAEQPNALSVDGSAQNV